MRKLTMGLVTAAIGCMPATASAANPQQGVHVDPGSPAGKQYAIPVNSARSQSSGGGGGGGSSGSAAATPLFGAGIVRSAGSATTAGGHSGSSAAASGAPNPAASGVSAASNLALPAILPTAAESKLLRAAAPLSAGGGAWLPLVGGGLLVLALGAGGGLALRSRSRQI